MPLLEISEARVQCPWTGSVDVDVCLSCQRLRSIRQDGGHEFVSCGARTDRMEAFSMYEEAPDRLGRIFRRRVA